MSVRVLLPNAFQKHTNNVREISSTAANLPELVTDIEGRFPALRQHLRSEDGSDPPLHQFLCERRGHPLPGQ